MQPRPRRPTAGCRLPAAYVPIFLAAFFAVRLPYLFAGYGADTDAYRVVLSGRYLWSAGEYLPSRLPGYPLHEVLTALLLWGGPFVTNLSTTLAALAGVLIFDRIVVALRVPGRAWLLIGMGFTPWLVVNSTSTLDYHFALTAMLGAYWVMVRAGAGAEAAPSPDPPSPSLRAAARERGAYAEAGLPTSGIARTWHSSPNQAPLSRAAGEGLGEGAAPLLAGVVLGIAAGFRITAGAFLIPLLVLVLWPSDGTELRGRVRAAAVLAGATVATAVLAYVPVLWTYGARFWNFADSGVSPDIVIQMVGQRALGVVGALAAVGAIAASWRRLGALPRLVRTNPHVLVWVLTVAIYALLFLRLPVDAGYLIPIYPFAFLLAARVLVRWALPAIVVASIVGGVVDLDIQGIHNFSPSAAAREVRPSWRVANFAHDYRTRTRWQTYAERIAAAPAPAHSVVLTGGAFPVVAIESWDRRRYEIVERDLGAVSMLSDNGALWDDERDVVYLAVSEPRIIDRFRSQGYAVYEAVPEGPEWRARLRPVE